MRLEWDKIGERKYETGTRNGVLYPIVGSEYPKGVAWNGITGVTESPSGAEANDLYADDTKYLVMRSAEEFGGTIEAYMYPDEWMECDGSAEAAPGLVLGQQNRKAFGFSYRTVLGNDTDLDAYGYKLHLIYNATASPSERAYQSVNDSPEAVTLSWEFETVPININTLKPDGSRYKPVSVLTVDSTKTSAEIMKRLEDILYGTEETDARLPLPDEVIQLLSEKKEEEDEDRTTDENESAVVG